MSVTQVPLQPIKRGSLTRLWLVIVALVALAGVVAWTGAGALRPTLTAHGVAVRTLQPGKGDPIGLLDGALIDYKGSLLDGTVFDSTDGKGPAPILATGVIPGFSEALQVMREGGKYAVRIPAAQAYGATPPPGIPANADLLFDITVHKVVRNAALMAQAQQQAQQAQQQGQPSAQDGLPQGAPQR